MFQIKDFTSIVAGAINHMRGTQSEITDFNVGSVARTMIEAPAIEIDELYQQLFIGLKEAIAVATYNTFNFQRQAAIPATGIVRVTKTSSGGAVTIAAETLFTAATGSTYASASPVTIAPGETEADVLVTARVAGIGGNLPAGVAFTMQPALAGFVSAVNLASLLNGRDVETEDERKQRFALYIKSLPRGTPDAILYGAKTVVLYDGSGGETERVRSAAIIEPWIEDPGLPPGLVLLYVHNGAGGTSPELVERVNQVIHGYVGEDGIKVPGYKAAGAKVLVDTPEEISVDVTGILTAAEGYDATELIATATGVLADYIATLEVGGAYKISDVIALMRKIDGVSDFVPTMPTVNRPVLRAEKIIAGDIELTAA